MTKSGPVDNSLARCAVRYKEEEEERKGKEKYMQKRKEEEKKKKKRIGIRTIRYECR